MAKSQNGYEANNRGVIGSYSIPGGKITARVGDVSVILLYVANRFHNEVEALVWPGNWGYAERAIRGSATTSNHASGTAIDLNAPRHPLGKVNTFNAAQRAKIREILNYLEGTVRWGGDYTGRKDDMHFEINKGLSDVARVANKIRGGKPLGGTTAPVPAKGAASNPDVKWIQERLTYWGINVGTADGINGPKTKAGILAFQRARGLGADGIVGPKTRAALTANRPVAPAGRQPTEVSRATQRAVRVSVDGYWGPGTDAAVNRVRSALNNSFPAGVAATQRTVGATADGKWGPKSKAALGATVKALQSAWGTTADGGWGPKTEAAWTRARSNNFRP